MILITSGAYVNPALIAEFGKLPPCMLPVQNKRLYHHQLRLLGSDEPVYLILPMDYDLEDYDRKELIRNRVNLLFLPLGLGLGGSIIYALNTISQYDEPLKILHGDTLLDALPPGLDVISVANAEDDYSWTYPVDCPDYAHAGYFAFSSQSLFIQKTVQCNNNFIEGIEEYGKVIKLRYDIANTWYDFGLVNSYYRSKSQMTTQRCFNGLTINRYSVKKFSTDIKKIHAEAAWFANIPVDMKHYTPALWNTGIYGDKGFYEIEYFYLSSLAELYVFGNNSFFIWKRILSSCEDYFLQSFLKKAPDPERLVQTTSKLFGFKTRLRFADFEKQSGVSIHDSFIINGISTPPLGDIIAEMEASLSSDVRFISIVHGDSCFSNILYDFKTQSIRLIDPRGLDSNGDETIYGDIRYDIGKFAHSVLGMYDFIISGNYEFEKEGYKMTLEFPQTKTLIQIQRYFTAMNFAGFSLSELGTYPVMVLLFLSMLPLHYDKPSRQWAMLANALRLYVEFKSQKNNL